MGLSGKRSISFVGFYGDSVSDLGDAGLGLRTTITLPTKEHFQKPMESIPAWLHGIVNHTIPWCSFMSCPQKTPDQLFRVLHVSSNLGLGV